MEAQDIYDKKVPLDQKTSLEKESAFNFSNEISNPPPPPYQNLLHIYYDNWKANALTVYASDKSTPRYHISTHLRKPHMRITNTTNIHDEPFATVNFHTFKTSIDITINSRTLTLSSPGLCNSLYCFTSPTFNNAKLTWKPHSKWRDPLDMVLLDPNSLPIAKFNPVNFAKKKTGKLELMDGSGISMTDETMDEIVVTALAVMQFRHIQRTATNAGVVAAVSS